MIGFLKYDNDKSSGNITSDRW